MKTTLLRAGALSCALLASTALTTPALAQATPPPVRHNVDRNGVDLVLGTFEMTQHLLSIGPDWPHGLSYARSRNGDRWVDNFSGEISQELSQFFVSIANSSAKFTYSGGSSLNNAGSFATALGDGATLTRSGSTFTFTNARGVVVRYTSAIVSGQIVPGSSRIVDITYPNGTQLNFNYRTQSYCDQFNQNCVDERRLQSVTNNFNYQMRFAYSQDTLAGEDDVEAWHSIASVRAINTAVEACDPTALSCSLTGSWPTVTFAYSGGTETLTLPDGNSWTLAGSAPTGLVPGGLITAIRRPGATSDDVAITYNGDIVSSVTNATGTWNYSFLYSAPDEITAVSDSLGTIRSVTSDPDNLVITSDEDGLGRATTYQYDSQHRITRITLPEGNSIGYTYDGRGNVTETRLREKDDNGDTGDDIVATASYDSTCSNIVTCNLPNSTTDARGNVTDYSWDSTHGGLLSETSPAPSTGAVRPQTRISYGSATVGGRTVYRPNAISACQTSSSCSGGADEALTTIAYSGSNDLPSSVSSGNGSGTLTATTALGYDDIGNPVTVDGPLSGSADTIRLRYNALRQVTGAISPDPDGTGSLHHRAVRTTYDSAGLASAVEIGTVNSQSDSDWAAMTVLEGQTTERDSFGRPVVERLVSGGTTYQLTQTSYDSRGRVRCVAQRMNPSEFATSALPSDNCTLDTQGSYGPDRITRTSYDAADEVTKVETGVGVTGVAADEVTTTYTDNGRVATVTDAEGNKTTYEYDGFDRLLNTRFPSPTTDGVSAPTSGAGADYEQLGYDAAGNVVSRRLRDGVSIGYTFDALGRLTGIDRPTYTSVGYLDLLDSFYAYDNLGRLTAATHPSTTQPGQAQWNLSFSYDALGRQLSQTDPLGTVSYGYDLAGQRTSITYPGSGLVIGYVYDVAGDLTEIRENPAGSNGLLATYGYDDRGRRTSLTRNNGLVTGYSYDNVDRLSQLTQDVNGTSSDLTLGFGYNPAGQIVSNTRDNTAYSFTGHANGARTDTINGLNQVTAVGGSGTAHDANGNLTYDPGSWGSGARYFGFASEGALISAWPHSMLYDPVGRMVQTDTGSSFTIQRFAYDGDNMIAEYDSGNAVARRYVFGPDGEPVVWYEGSGTSTRRYFRADERGSVIAVTDGTGNLYGTINRYDEYGVPQGTLTGRFGYTGQAYLPDSQLYDYRNRTYIPSLGRFLQPDPIGYEGGMNLYAYVRNDPVNLVDPSGLQESGGTITVTGDRDSSATTMSVENLANVPKFAHAAPTISDLGPPIVVRAERLKLQRAEFWAPRWTPFLEFFARPPIMRFPFPGNPLRPPGLGCEWRGNGPPESGRGSWYNPQTGESLHPDMGHPPPIGPHWDYHAPDGSVWRWFPDGTWQLKTIVI